MSKKVTFTETDMNAMLLHNSAYLNNKGAKLYVEQKYAEAVEYYRIAAAMGNTQSISNLGYCYLYGREIEQNTSIAIAYFKEAARRGNVDAAYKLGDIYSRDKWDKKDTEQSLYYYNVAAGFISDAFGPDLSSGLINAFTEYPSLCYALGRENALGGNMPTDIELAFKYLIAAKYGYEKRLANGETMYQESYEGVVELMNDSQFDSVRYLLDELDEEPFFN